MTVPYTQTAPSDPPTRKPRPQATRHVGVLSVLAAASSVCRTLPLCSRCRSPCEHSTASRLPCSQACATISTPRACTTDGQFAYAGSLPHAQPPKTPVEIEDSAWGPVRLAELLCVQLECSDVCQLALLQATAFAQPAKDTVAVQARPPRHGKGASGISAAQRHCVTLQPCKMSTIAIIQLASTAKLCHQLLLIKLTQPASNRPHGASACLCTLWDE